MSPEKDTKRRRAVSNITSDEVIQRMNRLRGARDWEAAQDKLNWWGKLRGAVTGTTRQATRDRQKAEVDFLHAVNTFKRRAKRGG